MAAEVHALDHAFDHVYFVREILEGIQARQVPLESFVDRRTLLNFIAKNSRTAERTPQVDVCALRESDLKGELKQIGSLPGKQNETDG